MAKLKSLSKLDLSQNMINDAGIAKLFTNIFALPHMTFLNLAHNFVSDIGAMRILQLLKTQNVRSKLGLRVDLCN